MSRITTYLTNELYQIKNNTKIPEFPNVLVGGTFDHLHNGHIKLLIIACLASTEHLFIAVCSDKMVKYKKYSEYIEDEKTRYDNVVTILDFIKPELKKTVVIINNPYEQSLIFTQDLNALVLSSETYRDGFIINNKRTKKGLNRISILEIQRSKTDISSTTIRKDIHYHYNKLNT
jgi:pantetheine-phosphate adenylyltransferase